jgi:hypothetical protein
LRIAQSAIWLFPSGPVYFRGAGDLCVYKEASTASVERIKHKHNHLFYLIPEFPRLRPPPRISFLSVPMLFTDISSRLNQGECNVRVYRPCRSSEWIVLWECIVRVRQPDRQPAFVYICRCERSPAEKCRVTVDNNTDSLLEQTSMGCHALSRE